MREIRQSGSEGGGTETNRFSLPLSCARVRDELLVRHACRSQAGSGDGPRGTRPATR